MGAILSGITNRPSELKLQHFSAAKLPGLHKLGAILSRITNAPPRGIASSNIHKRVSWTTLQAFHLSIVAIVLQSGIISLNITSGQHEVQMHHSSSTLSLYCIPTAYPKTRHISQGGLKNVGKASPIGQLRLLPARSWQLGKVAN